jgi:hypothetical protein
LASFGVHQGHFLVENLRAHLPRGVRDVDDSMFVFDCAEIALAKQHGICSFSASFSGSSAAHRRRDQEQTAAHGLSRIGTAGHFGTAVQYRARLK